MTFEQAKDRVAVNHGYENWEDSKAISYPGLVAQPHLETQAAQLYAKSKWDEACEAQRKMCAEDLPDEFIQSLVINTVKPEFKP